MKSEIKLIKLNLDNVFLENSICHILIAKNFLFTQDEKEKYFTKIHISETTSNLIIKINDMIVHLKKPINFGIFFQTILNLLSKHQIVIHNMIFFPFQQKLSYNNKNIYLNDIHNKVFSYLYLYKENGVDKYFLYQKIWPSDKDVFINKLDSHLSNLKNEIQKNLDFNFDYSSKNKLIRLIIN